MGEAFRILEGEPIEPFLRSMVPKEPPADPAPAEGEGEGAAQGAGEGGAAPTEGTVTAGGDQDVQMGE